MSTPLAFEPSPHPAPVETESAADFFRERHTVRIFIEPSLGHRQKLGGHLHVQKAVVIMASSRMLTVFHGRRDLFPDDRANLRKKRVIRRIAGFAHRVSDA